MLATPRGVAQSMYVAAMHLLAACAQGDTSMTHWPPAWPTLPHAAVQASRSPLAVCVAAGAVALPQLHKLARVRQATPGRGGASGRRGAAAAALSPLAATDTMPIELELGPEFRFHSIFVCPVAKEMTDKDNLPAMLSCGHVLAQASIKKIAEQRNMRFKCPYCPEETEPRFCKPLIFPPVQ